MIPSQLRPSRARTTVVLGALVLIIATLHLASRFSLRGPSNLTAEGLRLWLDDPVAAIATVARWVSLILAYYLIVVVAAAAFFGERIDDHRWGRLSPSAVTGLVGLLLGTTAVVVPAAAHMANHIDASAGPAPLVLQQVETPLTLVEVTPVDSPAPTLTPVTNPTAEASPDAVWTVESGDSFWSIAEETLAEERADQDLTDAEIAAYWRALISANESELVEPGNPDLILPGQVLLLPPT